LARILNGKLERFSLNFLRCANRDLALLNLQVGDEIAQSVDHAKREIHASFTHEIRITP